MRQEVTFSVTNAIFYYKKTGARFSPIVNVYGVQCGPEWFCRDLYRLSLVLANSATVCDELYVFSPNCEIYSGLLGLFV